MTPNDKIKMLRKELKLSQPAFGQAIGVSRDVIANIEYGRVELKESMVNLICHTFSVNPLWLMQGKGDMFYDVSDNLVSDLKDIYHLSDIETKIIKNYLKLSHEERITIIRTIEKLIK